MNNIFFSAQFNWSKKTWQHPCKTSRLWKHPDKHPRQVMKNCVKDRIDTILVSTALYDNGFRHERVKIRHAEKVNILIVLQYKSNKELSKISSIFWWYNYFIIFNKNKFTLHITNILQLLSYIVLALYFIVSFVLNYLGLQAYQTCQTVY